MNTYNRAFCHYRFGLVAFLLISFMSLLMGQTKKDILSGIVLVKFDRTALPQGRAQMTIGDITAGDVTQLLEQHGFSGAEKIFPHFQHSDTLARTLSGERVNLIDLSRWYRIHVADTINVVAFAELLNKTPGVLSASPDGLCYSASVYPNDPRFLNGQQWGLHNYGNIGSDIHAVDAWNYQLGRSDVVVAVVDGGVDYNHADLDPGNRSRVIQGRDVGNSDNDPMDDGPSGGSIQGGHGTSVAGVLGAITNNDSMVAGVMWNCSIMPIKISDQNGNTTSSKLAEAIDWARANGAHVINASLVDAGSNPLAEAVANAYLQDIVVVAAMGNYNNSTVYYPAGYSTAIAVGATNQTDARVVPGPGVTWGSNYGSHIDLVAPGINHFTTARYQSVTSFGGTSCATPLYQELLAS